MANHRIYNEPTRRVIVVLPERLRQVAIRLGQGNMRRGIALALERAEMLENEYQNPTRGERGEGDERLD